MGYAITQQIPVVFDGSFCNSGWCFPALASSFRQPSIRCPRKVCCDRMSRRGFLVQVQSIVLMMMIAGDHPIRERGPLLLLHIHRSIWFLLVKLFAVIFAPMQLSLYLSCAFSGVLLSYVITYPYAAAPRAMLSSQFCADCRAIVATK
jgi:hypothetical protein